jgi:hypothetical protein
MSAQRPHQIDVESVLRAVSEFKGRSGYADATANVPAFSISDMLRRSKRKGRTVILKRRPWAFAGLS